MQSLMRSLTPEQRAELGSTDRRAPPRRPAAVGPRPARREPRPAAARRPRRARPVQRATSRSASSRRWSRSAGCRRSTGSRRSSTAASGPGDLRGDRPGRGPRPAGRRMRPGTSTRSRTSRSGSRRRATWSGTGTGWSSRRGATGGSARRCSTSCSPGSGATPSAAIASSGRAAAGSARRPSKPFEFGDPFHLDLRAHAVERADARGERARPGRDGPAGAARAPTTSRSSGPSGRHPTSTVLLVDMSRSMLLRDCFLAAKKVAIALDTLIRTQYPRDTCAIVGFAYYARELRPEALAELSLARLRVRHEPPARAPAGAPDPRPPARRRTARSSSSPTASRRPTSRTARSSSATRPPGARSRRRSGRSSGCTKEGITINTFMLDQIAGPHRLRRLPDRASTGVARSTPSPRTSASTCSSTS